MSVNRRPSRVTRKSAEPSAEDIYLMMCLHRYQRMSCEKIARRFGIDAAKVREIIARRSNSGCCG